MDKLRCLAAALILLTASCRATAQQLTPADRPQVQRMITLADPGARLAVAVATADYPVTPGDVYTLTYLTAGQSVVYDIVVQSDYVVDLRLFGRVWAQHLTFHQLRTQVEATVARAYTNSAPVLSIRSVGVFPVYVKGAVKQPGRVVAWGLSRLSEVVSENLESFGSDRDVQVVSRDGQVARYDLYRALRLGDETQDPLLRSGDTVIVSASERTVTVAGEVRRPGLYHLTESDTAADLLHRYCSGTTPAADLSRVRLTRQNQGDLRISYLPLAALLQVELANGDAINVPARTETRPVVTFEGAVAAADMAGTTIIQQTEQDTGDMYGSLQVPITPGETLFNAFLGIKDRILTNADFAGATLLRQGQAPVPVDLRRLVSEYSLADDPVLQAYDRIVIPVTRRTVTVSGAVASPGSYYYAGGKHPSYYIALAGGIDPERNINGSLVVYDADGDVLPADAPVPVGARIVVLSNNFAYRFNRYFPVVTTSLAFITAVITVIDLLAR